MLIHPFYPKCWALVSGGKDSLTTAQVLHEAGRLAGCVSFKTGISTPDWEAFVIKVCEERGWPLEFYETDESYDDLVIRFGFPGPGMHGMFMNYLKGRCVRKFKKAHPDGILASGTRLDESERRFNSTKPVSVWENVPILTPIYDLTTDQTWAFFRDRGFERAPAYSTLQISGDCLCGAFANTGEPQQLAFHYPKLGEHFKALGREIESTFPKRCQWGWGCDRPRKPKSAKERAICVECGDTEAMPNVVQPPVTK